MLASACSRESTCLQDVYTESGMKRKGHDFPLQEGLRVSQDSRQLWLHQQPFKLKRGQSWHPSSRLSLDSVWCHCCASTCRQSLGGHLHKMPSCHTVHGLHACCRKPYSIMIDCNKNPKNLSGIKDQAANKTCVLEWSEPHLPASSLALVVGE